MKWTFCVSFKVGFHLSNPIQLYYSARFVLLSLLSFYYTGNFASWFVFFLTYFTFTTWLLCTTFCFFSSVLLFYIHLRSIICSLETKLNCFALLTTLADSCTQVRRRLLFVTLCSSRFMILPITTTTGWRDERSSPQFLLSRDIPLISFQCEKAKVVSDGGDQGFERLRSRFWDIFFSSLREKGIHIDR